MDESKSKTPKPITVAGYAIQGAKQFQEDSWFSWTHADENGSVVIGGVYDGHGGKMGQVASQQCREYSLKVLDENRDMCTSWGKTAWHDFLDDLFNKLHAEIRRKFLEQPARSVNPDDKWGVVRKDDNGGDPVHGGTTASIVVMFCSEGQYYLMTANVGDSTAVLCHRRQKKCETLTTDHGPEDQAEWKRVHNNKNLKDKLLFVYDKTNVYRKYELPKVFNDDGTKDQRFVRNPWGMGLHPTNVRYEPAVYAVSPGNIYQDATCIAMTRSLGDFYGHQFGLTHIPTIQSIALKTPILTSKHGPTCPLSPPLKGASENEAGTESAVNADNDDAKEDAAVSGDGTQDDSHKDLEIGEFSVFVGSDGIWDCWKYDDFTEYVNDCFDKYNDDIDQVARESTEESIRRAKANFGTKDYDDACLVGWRFSIPVSEE